MKAANLCRRLAPLAWLLVLVIAACNNDPPPVRPALTTTQTANNWKKTPLGKNVYFEVDPESGKRRVIVSSVVVLREGQLEGFLTIAHGPSEGKAHEYILSTSGDAREIHKALIAAGAEAGSPVFFGQGGKYTPASGTKIKVSVRYQKDGKPVTMRAQEWIRNAVTKQVFDHDWVFAGSRLIADPEDPNKQPFYEANVGDVICICNMHGAMLDIPIANPNSEPGTREWLAFTERIPKLGTPVEVLLEPVPGKDDNGKSKPAAETQDKPKPAESDDK